MDRNNTRFTTYHFKICQRRDKLIFVMTFVWSNEATSSYSCNLDQPSASRNLFQTEQARRRHENHCCSADFKCQCTFVGINPDLTSLISSVGKRDEERQPHFSLKYLVGYNHFFPPCTAHWVMWISLKKIFHMHWFILELKKKSQACCFDCFIHLRTLCFLLPEESFLPL